MIAESAAALPSPPAAPSPATPVDLRTYALAAAAALCPEGAGEPAAEDRYLRRHLRAATNGDGSWARPFADYLRHPAAADAPLVRLAGELGLTAVEVVAVSLAAAVEEDLMSGRAIAHLQAPLGGSRPTLGLLATCLAPLASPERDPLSALATGAAARSGLLRFPDEGMPLPERPAAVPLHLCFALRGIDGALPAGVALGLDDGAAVPLPPSIEAEARRQAAGLEAARQRALAIRSGSSREARTVAAAVAGALGLRPLFLETADCPGLSAWLSLRRLLPVFCFELGPDERRTLSALPLYRGPVLAACGPDGSLELEGGSVLSWSLPVPESEERRDLWQRALGDQDLAAHLAARHRHSSGRIAHLGRVARHRVALAARRRPRLEDVAAAAWSGEGPGLDGLAQPLPEPIAGDALIMPPVLDRELEDLLLRCQTRDRLVRGLGASARARYRPGVRALFTGPSGTGKTLATGWLATRLGIPLYRVDLASVTSKYIGETEKNLARLLSRAEQAEVVLLFDEADSLFGKRTDIKEANDRFANAQTNYLLQRIESFDGIVVLTSNSRARFDAAFTRRLDAVVDFPIPGPEDRRRLWRSHLGDEHRLAPRDVNKLAATADLCGGHIRNVVLAAAVPARHHDRPIELADVLRGLAAEYRKLGRQLPAELKVET